MLIDSLPPQKLFEQHLDLMEAVERLQKQNARLKADVKHLQRELK